MVKIQGTNKELEEVKVLIETMKKKKLITETDLEATRKELRKKLNKNN